MRLRAVKSILVVFFLSAGLLPVFFVKRGLELQIDHFIWINLGGWLLVVTFLLSREELRRKVSRAALKYGLDPRYRGLESLLSRLIGEVERKNSAFSVNLIQRKMEGKDELARTLERIVGMAYSLLDAESAELALFDTETGLYHSSFVLGKPFSVSAQAMLSGAAEGEGQDIRRPDVLIHPIAFAGSVLGSLRVALRKGTVPLASDQEIMQLLALQGSLAIINSEYTDQLMRMKEASEETTRAKTGFLANLSHEIRGPLGIMLNAVELVLDGLCGEINEDQQETLSMIQGNGEHLLELINDVLDYAKVESGKITPNKTDVILDDFLKDMVGVVRKQAESKGHKLKLSTPDEALSFSCDKRHARQMVINLLTNAIKYTPNNGEIELRAERIPGNKIKIRVKDNGVGIDPAEQHKVFAAFERVDNAYALNQMGTGLGMPLTKRLAEVNDATLDFKSKQGEGSEFWLVFSAVEYDSSVAKQSSEDSKDHAAGEGELVLLIQKEDGERKMIERYLAHIGFRPIPSSSRTEAAQMMKDHHISLVILDNNVGEEPQEQIIGGIREAVGGAAIPIVLMTSRAFVFDIEKYLKRGVDRCLVKPVELRELGFTIRQLIDGRYSGEVIDPALSQPRTEPAPKKKDTGPAKTRLLNLDDILH